MRDSRLIMAGTTLFGAVVPISNIPDQKHGFAFDELVGDTLNQKGWLGKPIAAERRLGLDTPILSGGNWNPGNTLIDTRDGNVVFSRQGSKQKALEFSYQGVDHSVGGDLLISVTASAEPDPASPVGNYRELSLHLKSSGDLPDYLAKTEYVSPVNETAF